MLSVVRLYVKHILQQLLRRRRIGLRSIPLLPGESKTFLDLSGGILIPSSSSDLHATIRWKYLSAIIQIPCGQRLFVQTGELSWTRTEAKHYVEIFRTLLSRKFLSRWSTGRLSRQTKTTGKLSNQKPFYHPSLLLIN